MNDSDRLGAQQPERFKPARAARLDDPARFAYLEPRDVLSLLDAPPAATLIDFGTGTGTYALEFARLRPDLRIIAFDEQAEMLALLQAKLAAAAAVKIEPVHSSQVEVLLGIAQRVFALNVLHELGDAALAELPRLLAPDGVVAIVDWNADVERPHGPPRDHVYGVDDARRRVERFGMHVRSVRLFPYHYALLCDAERTVR